MEETMNTQDFLERIMAERKAWSRRKKIAMAARRVVSRVRYFPSQQIHSVKWFIQRGRRGWSDCDLWNMDGHIARLNVEMLAELRSIAHGSPVGLGCSEDEQWLTPEQREERWNEIQKIDALIGFDGGRKASGFDRWMAMLAYFEDGWRGVLRESDDNHYREDHEKFKTMMPLYAEWFGGLWD
jgi:hypothetical protein